MRGTNGCAERWATWQHLLRYGHGTASGARTIIRVKNAAPHAAPGYTASKLKTRAQPMVLGCLRKQPIATWFLNRSGCSTSRSRVGPARPLSPDEGDAPSSVAQPPGQYQTGGSWRCVMTRTLVAKPARRAKSTFTPPSCSDATPPECWTNRGGLSASVFTV